MHNPSWADPVGGFAILLLLLFAVAGAAIAPGGIRNRQRAPQRILAAALLIGLAMSLLWPRFGTVTASGDTSAARDATSMGGVWTYGQDTLSLNQTGSYVCRGSACAGFAEIGTWRMAGEGTLIARSRDGHEVSWRIVRYHGRDRLGLMPAPGSGATWESGLTFGRATR